MKSLRDPAHRNYHQTRKLQVHVSVYRVRARRGVHAGRVRSRPMIRYGQVFYERIDRCSGGDVIADEFMITGKGRIEIAEYENGHNDQ